MYIYANVYFFRKRKVLSFYNVKIVKDSFASALPWKKVSFQSH